MQTIILRSVFLGALCCWPAGCNVAGNNSAADGSSALDYGVINVRDNGAKGDGITDDTTAIQYTIDIAAIQGRPVYIPSGTYVISNSLEVASYQTLRGDGQYMTIIISSTDGLRKKSSLSDVRGVTVEGMQFQTTNDGTNNKYGIDATAFSYSRFIDIQTRYFNTGILLSRGASAVPCFFNVFRDIYIFVSKDGIKIDDTTGYSVNTMEFDNVIIEDVGQWFGGNGIVLSGYGHVFTGIYVGLPYGNSAVQITAVTGNCILTRLYGESNMTYLIDNTSGTGGRKNTVIGPHIDSLSMLLTSNPVDPDLTIIP